MVYRAQLTHGFTRNSATIDGVKFNMHTLDYSVQQGSFMTPDLYCKYTKRIAAIIDPHLTQYHLYAGDSKLYTSLTPGSDNQSQTVSNLENCIDAITKWICANKLKQNQIKLNLFYLETLSTETKYSLTR